MADASKIDTVGRLSDKVLWNLFHAVTESVSELRDEYTFEQLVLNGGKAFEWLISLQTATFEEHRRRELSKSNKADTGDNR